LGVFSLKIPFIAELTDNLRGDVSLFEQAANKSAKASRQDTNCHADVQGATRSVQPLSRATGAI
ncbi:MAG TPA: hypothetical protein VIR76_05500, partial [Pusillimonas sp.]